VLLLYVEMIHNQKCAAIYGGLNASLFTQHLPFIPARRYLGHASFRSSCSVGLKPGPNRLPAAPFDYAQGQAHGALLGYSQDFEFLKRAAVET
jgi:hypothetical protein